MKLSVKLSGHAFRRFLLVLVVTVGTAALAVSYAISAQLDRLVTVAVQGGGRRVIIANANLSADSSLDWQSPLILSPQDKQTLLDANVGLKAVSIINELPWRQIEVAGTAYRPGTVLGADDQYADIMGLRFAAGSFFSGSDVSGRARVAVLSERAAKLLYGSSQDAVGKTFRGDRNIFVQRQVSGAPSRAESSYDSYTVVGVFKDVTAFERDVYGVPDYIVPYTVMFPADMPILPFARTFVGRTVDVRPLEGITAGLRSYLSQVKKLDTVKIAVWEGSIDRGGASSVEQVRSTLQGLSLITELFGFAILIVAAFGVVSSMMAEAAERRREMAIKRAIGNTVLKVTLELILNGLKLTALGGLAGFIISLFIHGFSKDLLSPFLEALQMNGTDLTASVFEPRSLLAPIVAVLLSGLFSFLPAMKSASEPIVDGLKE
ncbi:ABC transporter permease [Gracilinema caldarium]|uniref:ABC transporter permease n=1 Tax=Gracilinema caldarium TaxID=215591 RepID=UPI0026F351C1|nr:ABC transporter permease [Gracilinema caldarium]